MTYQKSSTERHDPPKRYEHKTKIESSQSKSILGFTDDSADFLFVTLLLVLELFVIIFAHNNPNGG